MKLLSLLKPKFALFTGLLAFAALSTTSSTSSASTVSTNEIFYICTLHVGTTYNLIELNSNYGCSGVGRGYVMMYGPGSGKTGQKLWSATRFETMTKWLLDNRWTGFSTQYDDGDMALYEIRQVSQ